MTEETHSKDGGRIPPQDIEAERALLGSIMLEDEKFPEILESIKPEDFYDKNHASIYRAMIRLYDDGKRIDLTTVSSALKSMKLLKDVGGAPYLAELTNVVSASHAESYAKIIESASIRRNLIEAGRVIADKAYDGTTEIEEILGNAEKELFNVSNKTVKTDYVAIDELLVDAFNRMEELSKNKGSLLGLKSGFPDIDKKTAGFQPGHLIVIGARPAMGKTTFVQNLAYNIASMNKDAGVLFFSMEMPAMEIMQRMISDVSGVKNWNIRTGNISEDEFSLIGDAMGEMDGKPVYIDDTSGMTLLELRNKAIRAKHDHPNLSVIIIDYLQLMSGSGRYSGNRVQEVTEISRGLKVLARELGVTVIALSQLSRRTSDRDDPRPLLTDLRESGSIEQDADVVMMLHRVDYYHTEEDYEKTNITEVIFAKNRHGEQGTVKLYFHPDLLRFMSLDIKSQE